MKRPNKKWNIWVLLISLCRKSFSIFIKNSGFPTKKIKNKGKKMKVNIYLTKSQLNSYFFI